jgi:putative hydrolase of the HAD superfamily
VIRAVFFDWGNTLVSWSFDRRLLVEGHVRGLAALGRTAPPQPVFTKAYEEQILPRLLGPGTDEIDYAGEIARLLATFGTEDDEAARRFVVAENRVWRPTHRLDPIVLDLLDGLRERGLKVGLVSNLFDPPELSRALFAELGLLGRLDAIALSSEVGKRKPHPALFQAALRQAGVAPGETVMVGDRLREDIGGAAALGMMTVQATWFDTDRSAAAEPDATASTFAELLRWLDDHAGTT